MVWTRLDRLSNLGIPSLSGVDVADYDDLGPAPAEMAQENPSAEVLSQQLTSLLLCASEPMDG